MLVRATLVIEIIAIIAGINRTYSQKLKINIYNIILFVAMLVVLEFVNFHSLEPIYTNLNLLFVLVYCKLEFKEKISHTLVSCGLGFAIITMIQFISGIILAFIPGIDMDLKNFIANLLSLLMILFVLPYCNLNYLRKCILQKNWVVYIITFFITIVLVSMIFQRKEQGGIAVENFIFTVPAIIIIFVMIMLWDKSVTTEKQLENELNTVLSMQDNYNDLVDRVRINQHGIKNHLTTMVSSYYSYKSYEQLVKEQKEYCGIIGYESRYDNLLKIKNRTLGGFLYGKMLEIEDYGINVEYRVETGIEQCRVPNYYLIELLGIFIDNAIDASKGVEESRIFWGLYEEQNDYIFLIRNTFKEVKYQEIEEWFKLNETTKDTNRGVGLYRAAQIRDYWNCDIIYSNEKIDNRNWIVFKVIIKGNEDNI